MTGPTLEFHIGEFMLMIRLARFGAKKKPFYRVVVIEKERARNGRNLEVVGHYNSLTSPKKVMLKHDRIEHWVKDRPGYPLGPPVFSGTGQEACPTSVTMESSGGAVNETTG